MIAGWQFLSASIFLPLAEVGFSSVPQASLLRVTVPFMLDSVKQPSTRMQRRSQHSAPWGVYIRKPSVLKLCVEPSRDIKGWNDEHLTWGALIIKEPFFQTLDVCCKLNFHTKQRQTKLFHIIIIQKRRHSMMDFFIHVTQTGGIIMQNTYVCIWSPRGGGVITKFAPKKHLRAEKQAEVSPARASLSFCWNYGCVVVTLQIIYYQMKGKWLASCVCMFSRD